MDEVVNMFELEIAETETNLTRAVQRMANHTHPELAARLAPADSRAYMDPLVLAYFQGLEDPGVTLDQLLLGYMDSRARPPQIQIRTDADGAAELPGIGILRTNHPATEMSLDNQLNLTLAGHAISTQVDQRPRVRHEHEPLLDSWVAPPLRFIVGSGSAHDRGASAEGVAEDLRRAVEILERVQPDFAELMNRTTRRVVVFDRSDMNSLAAPRAHGSVFLNLSHGRGAIYHLEDLLHQCGHVAFQAMTMYPDEVLSVDPDAELGESDAEPEPRTAYVVLHAAVTERWMVRGLLACLDSEELSVVERAEARGRLAYILGRYVLDLTDLVNANVTTSRGTLLLRQLLDDLRHLHALAQPYRRGLDMSGQPYNFHLGEFLERNPALIRGKQ